MISELMVLQSAAGYYIGRLWNNESPYDRQSGYFKTYEEAEDYLKSMVE